MDAAKNYFEDITLQELASTSELAKLILQVETRKVDPYTAARRALGHVRTRK